MPVSNDLIHAMTCVGETPGVTLHWYRPRISEMRVFRPSLDGYWIVTDDCGAWEPDADQVVLEVGELGDFRRPAPGR